ncbi:beta-lactamase hydrolase domain-containing protein [Kordiimonas marina]|uniref:beta-lactamase hydrolase domain-containing protein n=1 Tax=Kordiimonas marina TaxID=2872312 RepID=UPI001FF496DA|nr:sulfur transferase domain-containing protein [Kordiimonas marina]MCJ9429406.1 hypothetical protein [Kordiimonas marina]
MIVRTLTFVFLLIWLPIGAAYAGGAETGFDMKNRHEPLSGVMTGGKPTKEDLMKLKAEGYTTVINLMMPNEVIPTVNKADDEKYNFPEGDYVASLGLHYVSIPVKVPDGLTEANARLVDEALKAAKGPVLLHCSSGGRAGAMLALRAFYVDGAKPDEALALGRKGGVSILEPDVKAILGIKDE